ncbi:MAG TPA: RDD family protein [Phycisphaerae bacterium]|nr:RDD family protein [Phycisphaerae bacterium]
MNRPLAAALIALLAGGLSANAQAPDWKAARVWVAGDDAQVWVVAAGEPKGSVLPLVQFWHADLKEGAAIGPRQRLNLPPVAGDPVAIAADAGGLHVLYSDLTTFDYFVKRPISPGANWQAQCNIAPLAWCGDAGEHGLWALVETKSLVPQGRSADDEQADMAETRPAMEITERLALLQLRDGFWHRQSGPPAAVLGKRFWLAARKGDLHLFWYAGGEVHVTTLQGSDWTSPELVLKGDTIRYAWAGANEQGPIFMACRPAEDGLARVDLYRRGNGAWSMSEPLREGTEFLSVDPRRTALAIAGDQVVIARRAENGQIQFGSSDLTGTRPIRFEPLSLEREQPPSSGEWQDAIVLGLVLGMMTLVLWKRRDQVAAPIALPIGLVPAAVWRRVLATILDLVPAVLLVLPWWVSVMPDPASYGDVQSLMKQSDDPEMMAKLAPIYYTATLLYGLWCMIWEMLIGSSPGKYLFGCRVLSVAGDKPAPRQVFVRNVVRVIMVSMGAPGLIVTLMMIVMVTRNRQRVGDLLAGTIVVEPGVPEEITEPPPEDRPGDDGES